HDPKRPVPTIGGANLVMDSRGPHDQRPIESRPDVLVFSTDVLEEAIEVTGPIRAPIWITSSARDTDVCVRLADVYPDGRSILICDGARRAALRSGFEREVPLEPGTPAEVTVDLGSTSIIFAPGHRIRAILSSTNYPRFDANPTPARNAVLMEKGHPSRIVLPVPSRR
ncbi:MAG: CocE/NonD family hydrolase, partial [Planctomycetes bacterium]|nr:CocE/NonD family hydrolase [Planctomycetota bacterium]